LPPLAAFTVSKKVAPCVPDAAEPVTVIVYEPAGVDAVVVIVIVELAPDVTDAGENDALAPVGTPDADNDTDCAEPDVVEVDTVALVEPPAVTVAFVGDTLTEKSFGGGVLVTVRLSDVACEPDAADPVIVTGKVPAGVDALV
jgi:hypothetical protein